MRPLRFGRFGRDRSTELLPPRADMTEDDIYRATARATHAQQKSISDLMLQHKAGTISSAELADRIYVLLQPLPD